MQQDSNSTSKDSIPAAQVQTSKAAIASLIMGIFGFIIPLISSAVGLILGIVGLRNTRKNRGRLTGRGLALAGTIVSGVSFMLWLLPAALLIVYMLLAPAMIPEFESTGGYRFVCRVDSAQPLDDVSIEDVCQALKQRIDPKGWRGVAIQPGTDRQIEICVPVRDTFPNNLDDPKDLLSLLRGRGIFEFRILPNSSEVNPDELQELRQALATRGPVAAPDSRYIWCEVEDPLTFSTGMSISANVDSKTYILCSNQPGETLLQDGGYWKVKNAYQTTDNFGRAAIGFTFNKIQADQFFRLTGENLDKPLAIILDNCVLSAPTIKSAIPSSGIITRGSKGFTQTEAAAIVDILNAQPLPAAIQPIPESLEWIPSGQ